MDQRRSPGFGMGTLSVLEPGVGSHLVGRWMCVFRLFGPLELHEIAYDAVTPVDHVERSNEIVADEFLDQRRDVGVCSRQDARFEADKLPLEDASVVGLHPD